MTRFNQSDVANMIMKDLTTAFACGNVSNANLQILCKSKLREAIKLLEGGDDIVELA